jgi:drug/metabolite transporter (DMT)-like permease
VNSPAFIKARGHGWAVALLTFAALLFTLEVALVRYVGHSATAQQVIFCRALPQLAIMSAWFAWNGRWHELRTSHPKLHAARGIISLAVWWLYYQSFIRLDLALATTLTFTTQLFVVALAGPVLGEKVGLRRAMLALIGFAGVLVATGLGTVRFDPAILYGLTNAVGSAAIVFLTRTLTRTESVASILFYIGLITSSVWLVVVILYPTPIAVLDLALIVLAGMIGTAGMCVMLEAYRIGEVSALAPVPYVRLAFALVVGFFVFQEVPSWSTMLGAGIIVLAAVGASRNA